jgi:glutathione-regulated potassium-efflux system ancillary protein KefG
MANQVLIQFAHPALQKSRVNSRLIAAVQNLENVTINDLYEEYPDFSINVRREQELLLRHDVIIFHHPFYWYSCPALLKQWQDLVLEYGFAYGTHGTKLAGKWALTVITTGGSTEAYGRKGGNYYSIRELLAPLEQTIRLCGMVYLPPFVISGTLMIRDENEITKYAELYRRAVESLRDGTLELAELSHLTFLNDVVQQSTAA